MVAKASAHTESPSQSHRSARMRFWAISVTFAMAAMMPLPFATPVAAADTTLKAPVAAGIVLAVVHGYNDPLPGESCVIGSSSDHCRNQKYGLDLAPATSDMRVLAPLPGTVALETGGCMLIRTQDNLNLNVCHFATYAVGVGATVSRGDVLGSRSSSWIHLSLDDRYRNPSSSPYPPIPFNGAHVLEGLSLNPLADSVRNQYGDPSVSGWPLRLTSSNGSSGTTQPPAPPTSLSATPVSSTSIRVSWGDASSNETSFGINRWNGSAWVVVASAGQNATSWTDNGLSASTLYYYYVCSRNSAGTGCPANYTQATTLAQAVQVPAAPSNATVTATSPSNIHMTWSDNATNETGYRVTNNVNTVQLGANASSFDWPTNPSTYQCLAVQAYNSAGASAWTTWACTTTPSAGYGDVVVDDQSGGFVRAGTASYWHEYAGGYNGHFWWTYTNTSGVDDRAMWTPNLPATGRWEAYVFVPSPDGTTTNARYRVDHQGVQTTVSINQNAYSNVWVSLGTYTFNAGTGGDVFLGDETYETATHQIAFDAIKWVWRGP